MALEWRRAHTRRHGCCPFTSINVPAAPAVDRGAIEKEALIVSVVDGSTHNCLVATHLVVAHRQSAAWGFLVPSRSPLRFQLTTHRM